MSMILSLLVLWFVLNVTIVAAMYFKPLRALRLRLSRQYSSLAFARYGSSPIGSGYRGMSHRKRYSQLSR